MSGSCPAQFCTCTVLFYNLTVTFNPSDVLRVDGYADLTFVRAAGGEPWKIARWRDRSNF